MHTQRDRELEREEREGERERGRGEYTEGYILSCLKYYQLLWEGLHRCMGSHSG